MPEGRVLFNMDQIPILAIFLVVKALYPGERLWRWGVPRWIYLLTECPCQLIRFSDCCVKNVLGLVDRIWKLLVDV